MNSRWRAHLWLEWREHRPLVFGIVVVTVIGVTLMARYCVERNFGSADAPAFAAMAAAALVVLTLGGEILGRELAGDVRVAISRLPAALATPFLLRIAFLAGVVSACSTLAWWTMYGAIRAFSVRPILDIATVRPTNVAMLVALVSAWTLAASCWVRRTPYAAPFALLLLAALFAPLWIRVEGQPIIDRIVSSARLFVGLAIVAGLVAAWRSFARGHRSGGGRAGAIRAGAGALFILIAPIHLTAAYRTYDWISFDPTRDDHRIWNAIVGEGARYAYVNAWREVDGRSSADSYGYVVDLSNGTCTKAGVGWSFQRVTEETGRVRLGADSCVPEPLIAWTAHPHDSYRVIDAGTNAVIGDLAAVISDPRTRARFDARRERSNGYAKPEIWPPPGWRVNDYFITSESPDSILFFEFDAEKARDRGLSSDFALLRLNLRTGERTRITDPRGSEIGASFSSRLRQVADSAPVTPSGSVVLLATDAEHRTFALRLARGEPRAATTRACLQRVAAILDDDTILAVLDDGRSLAKLRFDGSDPEVLFPRAESRCVDDLPVPLESETR